MFLLLSSWLKSLREFTLFSWWMQTEHPMAANPHTKPIDLGCESAENWLLPSTSTIAIVNITQPISWYSFYCHTEGGKLSRPRHCIKGAQPMPKAVYCSGCRDKQNHLQCDSNLIPLTPQSDALTTRLLRPGTKEDRNFRGTTETNFFCQCVGCWSLKVGKLVPMKAADQQAKCWH